MHQLYLETTAYHQNKLLDGACRPLIGEYLVQQKSLAMKARRAVDDMCLTAEIVGVASLSDSYIAQLTNLYNKRSLEPPIQITESNQQPMEITTEAQSHEASYEQADKQDNDDQGTPRGGRSNLVGVKK